MRNLFKKVNFPRIYDILNQFFDISAIQDVSRKSGRNDVNHVEKFNFAKLCYCSQMHFKAFRTSFFDVLVIVECFWLYSESIWGKRKFSKFSSFFRHFFRHISSPEGSFPWSNQAHIEGDQSSNINLKSLLRICQMVRYFYQKYGVKGSKLRTSAGMPKVSRRPA